MTASRIDLDELGRAGWLSSGALIPSWLHEPVTPLRLESRTTVRLDGLVPGEEHFAFLQHSDAEYLGDDAPLAPWLLPDGRPPLAVWRCIVIPPYRRTRLWWAGMLVLHGLDEEPF